MLTLIWTTSESNYLLRVVKAKDNRPALPKFLKILSQRIWESYFSFIFRFFYSKPDLIGNPYLCLQDLSM